MDIIIFDVSNIDNEQMNALQPNKTVLEAVESEFYINFDFYNEGTMDSHIIRLSNGLYCLYLEYSIDKIILNDDVSWFTSAIVNIDSFASILDFIQF